MDESKRNVLTSSGVDLDGAMERFMDNEQLYWNFLTKFTVNPSFAELEKVVEAKDWEQALNVSHNLKGITGGLGFTHLYDLFCTQVTKLRQNDPTGAALMMDDIMTEYHRLLDIVKGII